MIAEQILENAKDKIIDFIRYEAMYIRSMINREKFDLNDKDEYSISLDGEDFQPKLKCPNGIVTEIVVRGNNTSFAKLRFDGGIEIPYSLDFIPIDDLVVIANALETIAFYKYKEIHNS